MGEILLKLLTVSYSASLLIGLVLCARPFLKQASGRLRLLLWALVALRLLLPFSFETAISVLPAAQQTPVVSFGESYVGEVEIHYDDTPEYKQAVDAGTKPVYQNEGGAYVVTQKGSTLPPKTVKELVFPVMTVIWVLGTAGMLTYAAVSYLLLRRKVSTAVKMQGNVCQSEEIAAPFVMGILKPRIYLPYGLKEAELTYVIAHEQAHITRGDHLLKPFGFLLLCFHWFNPLVWAAYLFFCKDIELACDQKTVKNFTSEQKADYAKALLACSMAGQKLSVCPVAFGEVGVKERVKSLLSYKKPTFWVILAAVLLMLAGSVFFFTKPTNDELNKQLLGAHYHVRDVLLESQTAVPEGEEQSIRRPIAYCITADYDLYQKWDDGEAWEYLGQFVKRSVSNEELSAYLCPDMPRIGQITDSYWLKRPNDEFYLALQTKNGRTYLGYGWEDVSERGQDYSDDTHLRRFYELESEFEQGHINVNFFDRSLVHAVGERVQVFHNFESKDLPGYMIVGFYADDNADSPYGYNDMGFAVFETNGKGYRLLNHYVYDDAVYAQNGVYFCKDPAVADRNGVMTEDNTFDVVLVANRDVRQIKQVYRAKGKKDKVLIDDYLQGPCMSLWVRKEGKGYSEVITYCIDKDKDVLSMQPAPAVKPVLWFDDSELEQPNWGGRRERDLEEFPDVTFRWLVDKVDAVKEDGEIITLYRGNPIYNVYFADLTGDGYPELVSITQSQHPQQEGQVLQIYDYKNHSGYAHSTQGYDYRLSVQEERLMLQMIPTKAGFRPKTYTLAYLDETIQMIPVN